MTSLLLVEDDDLIQEALEVALIDAGFKVVAASSGAEALSNANRSRRPALYRRATTSRREDEHQSKRRCDAGR